MKPLPRRMFLKSAGIAIGLPMLDSMIPAMAKSSDPLAKIPVRVGYVFSPNGIVRDEWLPTKVGTDYDMPGILKQWEPYRDQVLVVSNLDNGDPNIDRGHVSACSMYLTGTEPYKSLNEARCGTSVDQIIAAEFGKETPFSSLQVCIENAAELAGQSAGGYNSAYTNTVS